MQDNNIKTKVCECGKPAYHTYKSCIECRRITNANDHRKYTAHMKKSDSKYGKITPCSKVKSGGLKDEMWNINDSAIYC